MFINRLQYHRKPLWCLMGRLKYFKKYPIFNQIWIIVSKFYATFQVMKIAKPKSIFEVKIEKQWEGI